MVHVWDRSKLAVGFLRCTETKEKTEKRDLEGDADAKAHRIGNNDPLALPSAVPGEKGMTKVACG